MANTDPNVGTRNWTVFVSMLGDIPQEVTYMPLTYRTSTGQRPTDEWLLEDGFAGYIEPPKPLYNKYTQKVITTPLSSLRISNGAVTQTYSVLPLEPEEQVVALERLREDINKERERRVNEGCTVNVTGVGAIPIKGSPEDMRNLTNLGQAANFSIVFGLSQPIKFRDNDNVDHELSPMQMAELWSKAVLYVSSLYQASWNIKDSDPIPYDFINDSYWPPKTV